ncbi:hypothetical protein GGH92_000174 [Coemansia sp. RSA 2673]|nr:hypothetical protein GGH92_000174 [Coemansia sp. RSA 2673]
MKEFGDLNLFHHTEGFRRTSMHALQPYSSERAFGSLEYSSQKFKETSRLLKFDFDNHGSTRKVLVNLTKGEYVRESRIPDLSRFGLGHILLIQICWSDDPSMSMNCDDETCRGPWAGHRFEMTRMKKVRDEWKDVSETVIKKVGDIFDREGA